MSIKSFDNLLELIKEEIKAYANAILCTSGHALTRVDKVPGVRQRYIRARFAICTANSHIVYQVFGSMEHLPVINTH
jgi:hypothetical protein